MSQDATTTDADAVTAQRERDFYNLTRTTVIAGDTVTFALTCWLLALTTQAFTKTAQAQPGGAKWGHGIAGGFLLLGACAMLCVSSRLFQTHYKNHPPALFQK